MNMPENSAHLRENNDKKALLKESAMQPAPRQSLFKWILLAVIIALTFVIMQVMKAAQPIPPVTEKPEKAWPVNATTLQASLHQPQIQLLGVVESPYTSTMKSAVSADVVTLHKQEGDKVQQGELMISLDATDLRLQLAQRQADILDLQAKIASEKARHATNLKALENEKQLLSIAEKSVERERKLTKSNVTSASQLDQAEQALALRRQSLDNKQLDVADHPNRLQQLEAQLNRAIALKDQTNTDLARTQILAPFTGRITQLMVSPGERVRAGDALISLFDESNIEVRAQIPQRWLPLIQQAQAEQNTLKAQAYYFDQHFDLQLQRLTALVNEKSGGVDALFRITSGHAAPLASTVTVTLNMPTVESVYDIPVSGVYGMNRIYLVNADQRLIAQAIDPIGSHFRNNIEHILFHVSKPLPYDTAITTQLPTAINGLKVEQKGLSHE